MPPIDPSWTALNIKAQSKARESVKNFSFHKPKTIEQAVDLLRRHGESGAVLAGGTDLLVEMKQNLRTPAHVIDVKGIRELGEITKNEDGSLVIGATVTLSSLNDSHFLEMGWNLLSQAASRVGSAQVRNRATLGGNICHASPSGDTLPALLCLDARMKLIGPQGEREVPAEEFFLGPGRVALRPAELLAGVILPGISSGLRGVYKKFSLRRMMDLALVGVGVLGEVDSTGNAFRDIRIGLGAVAPTPIRAKKAEKALTGIQLTPKKLEEISRLAAEEASPISDIRGADWYRKEMAFHLTQEALEEIWNIGTPDVSGSLKR
jgi:CO/xanthine dehydrogenase FAD-binding subunit